MVAFSSFLRSFKQWDSEAQEKGFRSLHQYLDKMGRLTDQNAIWAAFAYLIQKDHESQEWFVKLIGEHVTRLENEIKALIEKVRDADDLESPAAKSSFKMVELQTKIEAQDATIATLREELAKVKKSVAKLKA